MRVDSSNSGSGMPSTEGGSECGVWGKSPGRAGGGGGSGVEGPGHSPPSLADIMAEQHEEAEIEEEFRKCGVMTLDDEHLSELNTSVESGAVEEDGDADCAGDRALALFLSQDPDCSLDDELARK